MLKANTKVQTQINVLEFCTNSISKTNNFNKIIKLVAQYVGALSPGVCRTESHRFEPRPTRDCSSASCNV